MITVTEKAKQRIREFAEEQGLDKLIIRIKVLGGGCAGFQYDLYFDEIITDLDMTFENDDVKIVTDTLSHQYLDNSEIDLAENGISTSFKINNPNITQTCGCAKSFKI